MTRDSSLKILVVSPQVPYPLLDGGRKAIYYQLRGLADRGHQIRLVCLSDDPAASTVGPLEEFAQVSVHRHSKQIRVFDALASVFSTMPYVVSRFHEHHVLDVLRSELDEFDIVHCEGLHCAWYGLRLPKSPTRRTVLRLHNVESQILRRWSSVQSDPLRRLAGRLEAIRLERYEERVCNAFDLVLTISETDLMQLTPAGHRSERDATLASLSPGVDLEYFDPSRVAPEPSDVLWLGAMNWPPNMDGLEWFCRDVVPRIRRRKPEARIVVVGSAPPPRAHELEASGVELIGEVDDVRPWIRGGSVCVVPLRVGGGVRFKVLELLAMQKAVVSTRVGAEGLGTQDGEQLLERENAEAFADATIRLLEEPGLREQLGNAGRAFVAEHYSWAKAAQTYEHLLMSMLGDSDR